MRFPSLWCAEICIYGDLCNGQNFRPCIFHCVFDFCFINFWACILLLICKELVGSSTFCESESIFLSD